MEEFPHIHFFLCEKTDDGLNLVRQTGLHELSANPHHSGKGLAKIEMLSTRPNEKFYSEKFAGFYREARERWRKTLNEIEGKLKTHVAKNERKTLQGQEKEYRAYLAASNRIPLGPTEGTTEYRADVIPLDKSWDNPASSLHALIDGYKEVVRDIALDVDQAHSPE